MATFQPPDPACCSMVAGGYHTRGAMAAKRWPDVLPLRPGSASAVPAFTLAWCGASTARTSRASGARRGRPGHRGKQELAGTTGVAAQHCRESVLAAATGRGRACAFRCGAAGVSGRWSCGRPSSRDEHVARRGPADYPAERRGTAGAAGGGHFFGSSSLAHSARSNYSEVNAAQYLTLCAFGFDANVHLRWRAPQVLDHRRELGSLSRLRRFVGADAHGAQVCSGRPRAAGSAWRYSSCAHPCDPRGPSQPAAPSAQCQQEQRQLEGCSGADR